MHCIRTTGAVLLTLLAFSVSSKEKITKLSSAVGNFPPYVFCDDQQVRGIAVDLIQAIFGQQGVSVQFKCYPWARVYGLTREAVFDITLPYVRNEQREFDFHFVGPIIQNRVVLFHHKDRKFPELMSDISLEKLKKYKIGANLGYRYGKMMDDFDARYGLQWAKTSSQNYRKLILGRTDLYVSPYIVGHYERMQLPENEAKEITSLPDPIQTTDSFIIISKKHPRYPEISRLFLEGITKIKMTELIEKLSAKYQLPTPSAPGDSSGSK
ncbi:substrate-binding periplasmic protein [Dongshaea marina]|uniref:substrate-binding periplasmic protein n=1 Tax=Dongshaea marina TaxID=2047966 RepID=UPI00131F12DB|nr:transporter substrate-binding domain-containing protein [Dongshaea marina]